MATIEMATIEMATIEMALEGNNRNGTRRQQ
jgi:hypothetical protein